MSASPQTNLEPGAGATTSYCRAAADPMASKNDPPPAVCQATLRDGRSCERKSKGEHPEHGPLCGVHMRCALRQKECSICLGVVNARSAKQLGCGHCFHRRCIKKWFGRGSLTCPLCREVCLGELSSSNPLISARIRHLLRMLPPPPSICFAAYMLGLLNSPPILEALGVTADQQQLLVELAYQSFTQHHFFEYLRQLNL